MPNTQLSQAINYGNRFLAVGKLQEAANAYNFVLNVDNKSMDALWGLSNVYRKANRHCEAINCLDKCLAVNPSHKPSLWLKGICYWDLGNTASAKQYLEKVFEASFPSNQELPHEYFLIADAILGEIHSIDSRLSLIDLYLSQKRYPEAFAQVARNYSLNQREKNTAKYADILFTGKDFPVQLCMEPTNMCKMACVGCGGRGGNIGFMGLDNFEKIMREVGPHLEKLVLHNRGDSFYHPDIYKMLDIVGNYPNIHNLIHTHGCFDMDAKAIVHSNGLHELVFSIDGASQKTYSQYRRKGKIDLCFENIRNIQAEKKAQNKRYPEITWKFIVMKTNEHEIKIAEEKSQELGCDRFELAPFGIGWPTVYKMRERLPEYIERFVPTDKNYLSVDYDAILKGQVKMKNYVQGTHCFHVNITKPIIRWNGDVAPCCNCFEPHANLMGNCFAEGSYKAVWDSSRYRNFRKQAVIDCRKLKPCDSCHMVN